MAKKTPTCNKHVISSMVACYDVIALTSLLIHAARCQTIQFFLWRRVNQEWMAVEIEKRWGQWKHGDDADVMESIGVLGVIHWCFGSSGHLAHVGGCGQCFWCQQHCSFQDFMGFFPNIFSTLLLSFPQLLRLSVRLASAIPSSPHC